MRFGVESHDRQNKVEARGDLGGRVDFAHLCAVLCVQLNKLEAINRLNSSLSFFGGVELLQTHTWCELCNM